MLTLLPCGWHFLPIHIFIFYNQTLVPTHPQPSWAVSKSTDDASKPNWQTSFLPIPSPLLPLSIECTLYNFSGIIVIKKNKIFTVITGFVQ